MTQTPASPTPIEIVRQDEAVENLRFRDCEQSLLRRLETVIEHVSLKIADMGRQALATAVPQKRVEAQGRAKLLQQHASFYQRLKDVACTALSGIPRPGRRAEIEIPISDD